MKIVRRNFRFYGRVQGVGFRAFCEEAGRTRGLKGWVKNLPDRSVELEAEGDESAVDKFLLHVRSAHPWARVDKWDASEVAPRRDDEEIFKIDF